MDIIPLLQKELEQEAQTTRRMLARVPNDKYDWQPHPKSMTMRQLASHIAEIPTWIGFTLGSDELDFATHPYQPVPINNTEELMAFFEKALAEGKNALAAANEAELARNWTMRNGADIYESSTKYEALRGTYGQIVHHRAQLGVYLRLLNIPIPGTYGPSADESSWEYGS